MGLPIVSLMHGARAKGTFMRICLRFLYGLGVIILLFSSTSASAEEGCIAANTQDILDCARRLHPDVMVSRSEALRDEKLTDIAKQRPNPAFDTRLLAGETADDTVFNTEDTLLFNVELGGKRRARIDQAKAESNRSQIGIRKNMEIVTLETVRALYRLRQIDSELSRVNETVSAYDKIIRNFRLRPKLTPEQEASRTTFELAKQDFQIKKISLVQEQANLSRLLELATELPNETIRRYLPKSKQKWSKLEPNASPESLDNAAIAEARSEQSVAEKKLKVAQSKAWPDLFVGPTFDTETSSNDTRLTGGLGVAIALPVLNRNQGEKSFATADRIRAETQMRSTVRKIWTERAIQLRRYEAALQALRSQSPGNLNVQHENVEAFYERGLLPSTLVIEAHSQWYDVVRARHDQELTAVDAFWRVQIIDGKMEETKL